MGHLYLTRKWIQNQQTEALLGRSALNAISATTPNLHRISSKRSGSMVSGSHLDDNDVEDLEMLLEAYFMQLDGTRNKILLVSYKLSELLLLASLTLFSVFLPNQGTNSATTLKFDVCPQK